MNQDKLQQIKIADEDRNRPGGSTFGIFSLVIIILGIALFMAWPRASDKIRVMAGGKPLVTNLVESRKDSVRDSTKAELGTVPAAPPASSQSRATTSVNSKPGSALLTVSGYIIAHERIELSPRFLGVVKWIGVKKGDSVTNGQVVVLLDDAEYLARLTEMEGRMAGAIVALQKAELEYQRVRQLVADRVEMQKAEDDARIAVNAAKAVIHELEGTIKLGKTYLDWTTIRSPINGVVLEKLVDPNELVVPQSFGGGRGPSTALISVADLNDLQVEVDISESDLSKIHLNQKCRITPEAFLEKSYEGFVAEVAPEANRAKGTLQIKVQIQKPDRFLTPELSAKVEFLAKEAPAPTSK